MPAFPRLTCLMRHWLLCLLVLALPAQGVAAATMRFCAPAHHDMAAMAAAPAHPAAHAAAQHQHHGQVMTADPDQGSAPTEAADQSRCSACAVCCAAMALYRSPPVLPALAASQGSVAALPASAAVFLTGGPERPPRPSHS